MLVDEMIKWDPSFVSFSRSMPTVSSEALCCVHAVV